MSGILFPVNIIYPICFIVVAERQREQSFQMSKWHGKKMLNIVVDQVTVSYIYKKALHVYTYLQNISEHINESFPPEKTNFMMSYL